MEFFNLKSDVRHMTAVAVLEDLSPELVKSSREAIVNAAGEGLTFVNIDNLSSVQAHLLARFYKMLDFNTTISQNDIKYIKGQGYVLTHFVTIRWED